MWTCLIWAVPQFGFRFHSRTYNLRNTVVLLISHSGGTFATLNVSNLLKGYTANLFVVTSEWDTQIARSVRSRPRARSSQQERQHDLQRDPD